MKHKYDQGQQNGLSTELMVIMGKDPISNLTELLWSYFDIVKEPLNNPGICTIHKKKICYVFLLVIVLQGSIEYKKGSITKFFVMICGKYFTAVIFYSFCEWIPLK